MDEGKKKVNQGRWEGGEEADATSGDWAGHFICPQLWCVFQFTLITSVLLSHVPSADLIPLIPKEGRIKWQGENRSDFLTFYYLNWKDKVFMIVSFSQISKVYIIAAFQVNLQWWYFQDIEKKMLSAITSFRSRHVLYLLFSPISFLIKLTVRSRSGYPEAFFSYAAVPEVFFL